MRSVVSVSNSRGQIVGPDRALFAELRVALVKQRAAILQRHYDVSVERVAESQEQSAILARNELSARAANRDRDLVRQIDAALRRMDEDVYGECGNCETRIKPSRLLALPWAGILHGVSGRD
jgi:RNA polymerase-binding transcription factor DksA